VSATIYILPVVRSLNAPDLSCDCEPNYAAMLGAAPDFSSLVKLPDALIEAVDNIPTLIPYEVRLDLETADKLERAAELANVDIEQMLKAMIIWGIKQVQTMKEDDFLNTLTACGDAKC
jgi:hypothetical protein